MPIGDRTLPALVSFTQDEVHRQQTPTRYTGSSKHDEIAAYLKDLIKLNGDDIGVHGPTTIRRFLLRRPLEPKLLLLCDTSQVPVEFRALSQQFRDASVASIYIIYIIM